jgi:hypothetical protein
MVAGLTWVVIAVEAEGAVLVLKLPALVRVTSSQQQCVAAQVEFESRT